MALLVVLALGVAPMRFVQAAVSATVGRVLQPVARAAPSAMQAVVAPRSDDLLPAQRRRIADAPAVPLSTERETAQLPAAGDTQPAPERGVEAVEESLPSVAAAVADRVANAEPTLGRRSLGEGGGPLLVALSSPVPVASPPAADSASRSPWSSAADAGVAIGSGSKRAGVATAGAFTRFAKKIAGSF